MKIQSNQNYNNISKLVLWSHCFFMMLIFATTSLAQDNSEVAENAVNPVAFVTKVQFQPGFTWKDNDARVFNLTSRFFYPSASIGLPFIKSKNPKVYTIYRIEAPIIGQSYQANKTLDAVGLGDIILLDAIVFKRTWGALGIGPAFIIPTMKPETISSRKLSTGLVFVVLNKKTKGLQWGALLQQFFNFAGDSNKPNQNFMLLQPILTKIFVGGTFVQFSPNFNLNWSKNTFNIPVSISLGKTFAKNLSMQAGPEYVVSGPNKGDFIIKFQINTMFLR